MLNDAHCHFFSTKFFSTLSQQRGKGDSVAALCKELGWDDPGEPDALADRWVQELDAHQVARAALIASVPERRGVGRSRRREAPDAIRRLLHGERQLGRRDPADARRGIRAGPAGACACSPPCTTPALDDERVRKVIDAGRGRRCRGVRALRPADRRRSKALGLPSAFDLRLGDPLEVARLANAYPSVPFIVPHFGAGLLREALIAADVCPNIYLDTSSSNRWMRFTPGLTLDDVFRAALAVVGPGRILFGRTRRTFRAAGSAASTTSRRRRSIGSASRRRIRT
jgi:hypothetical protein